LLQTIISLVEWEAAKEEEIEEEKEVYLMEDQDEANEGEMLVLRRALSGLRRTKEEQQENIFLLSVSKGMYAL